MDMRVGTDVIDVQKDTIPDLDAYETVVLLLSDLDPLKEKVLDICEWVGRWWKCDVCTDTAEEYICVSDRAKAWNYLIRL